MAYVGIRPIPICIHKLLSIVLLILYIYIYIYIYMYISQ